MRSQAMIALSGMDVDERVTAAVERSGVILDPALAEIVERLIASSHVRTAFVGSVSRTRGQPDRYAWER